MELITPLFIIKNKKNQKWYLNLNNYRNTHYQTLNKLKITFKEEMFEQIKQLPPIPTPVEITYTVYPPTARLFDISNVCSVIDKFLCDAITELGKWEDDNYTCVPRVIYEFGSIDKNFPRCEVSFKRINKIMKVFVTKEEMQLAVLAYFGLPINAEVALQDEPITVAYEEVSEVDAEDLVVVKQPRKRRRRKQNANTPRESQKEVQEVSPQVSADELAEQVASEVEPVNDAAFNEYPNVDGFEVQSESDNIEEKIVTPRNDIEIPEFVEDTEQDNEGLFESEVDDEPPFEEPYSSLFVDEEPTEESESLLNNTSGNDVSLFDEVIAETPEEDELPVNETPSLFL